MRIAIKGNINRQLSIHRYDRLTSCYMCNQRLSIRACVQNINGSVFSTHTVSETWINDFRALTKTSQDTLSHMRSICAHILATKTVHNKCARMHVQLNYMHIFMQAACNDTDMDTHTRTRRSPVLTDMRDVSMSCAYTWLSHSHTQHVEMDHGDNVYNAVSLYMSASTHMLMLPHIFTHYSIHIHALGPL